MEEVEMERGTETVASEAVMEVLESGKEVVVTGEVSVGVVVEE